MIQHLKVEKDGNGVIYLIDEYEQKVAAVGNPLTPEVMNLELARHLACSYNHARACPYLRPRDKGLMVLDENDRCTCQSEKECPLGKRNFRCHKDELIKAGFGVLTPKQADELGRTAEQMKPVTREQYFYGGHMESTPLPAIRMDNVVVAKLKAQVHTLKAVIVNDSENEERARAIAVEVLDNKDAYGNSYAVPTVADIVQSLVDKIKSKETPS